MRTLVVTSLLFSFLFIACSEPYNHKVDLDNPFSQNSSIEVRFSKTAAGVSPNSKLALHFKKNIDASTLSATTALLVRLNDTTPFILESQSNYDNNTSHITLDYGYLTPNQNYRLTLTDSISYHDGLPLEQNFTYEFSTGDNLDLSPPGLVSSIENQTNVSLFRSIVLEFNESIDYADFNASMLTLSDHNTSYGFSVLAGKDIVLINPNNVLKANTQYTLSTNGEPFKDLAGNTLFPNDINFTTQNSFTSDVNSSVHPVGYGLFSYEANSTSHFFSVDSNFSFTHYSYDITAPAINHILSTSFSLPNFINMAISGSHASLYALENNGTHSSVNYMPTAYINSQTAVSGIHPSPNFRHLAVNNDKICLVDTEHNTTSLYTLTSQSIATYDTNTTGIFAPHHCYIENNHSIFVFSPSRFEQIDQNAIIIGSGGDIGISRDITPIDGEHIFTTRTVNFVQKYRHDSQVYGAGANGYEMFGDTNATARHIYTLANLDLSGLRPFSSKGFHILALDSSGLLYGWGRNANGELGINSTTNQGTPTPIFASANFKKVSAGDSYSLALEQNGTLWGWGKNDFSQAIGELNGSDKLSPVQIGNDTNWSKISAGETTSFAIRTNGSLWAWGSNAHGQITADTTLSPSQFNTPTQIGVDTNWTEVYACNGGVFAKRIDNSLWSWGKNTLGNLAQGNFDANVSMNQESSLATDWDRVVCTSQFTIALKHDGTLWASGDNTSGQFGNGLGGVENTFTQIAPFKKWKDIQISSNTVLARAHDNTVWSWGQNSNSKAGLNHTNEIPLATRVPSDKVTQALRSGNHLYFIRDNRFERIKVDGTSHQFYDLNITTAFNHMALNGNFAFISATGSKKLLIFDITKTALQPIRVFDTNSSITGLTIVQDELDTRLLIGHDHMPSVESIDISNITSVTFENFAITDNTQSNNNEVVVVNDKVFTTSDTNLSVYDAYTLEFNSTVFTGNAINSLRHTKSHGVDYLLLSYKNDGVEIYEVNTSQSPVQMTLTNSLFSTTPMLDAALYDYNVSNPSEPRFLVSLNQQSLSVYDMFENNITNATPPLLSSTPVPNGIKVGTLTTQANEHLVLLSTSDNKILEFTIDPSGALELNNTQFNQHPTLDFSYSDNLYFAPQGAGGVQIFDCGSLPCSLAISLATNGYTTRVESYGFTDQLYIADYTGITVFNGTQSLSQYKTSKRIFDFSIVAGDKQELTLIATDGNATLVRFSEAIKFPRKGGN